MMYRYGDATPFPLEENFIETICAATDTCVGLFEAGVIAEGQRIRSHDIREAATTELKRLEVLSRAVESAVGPMIAAGKQVAKTSKTSQATAARIVANAKSSVKQARTSVIKRRDATIRAIYETALGANITAAVESLVMKHELPKTKWTVRWAYDHERGDATVVIESNSPCGLRARYQATLPEHHAWSRPIRVSELEPNLAIELERETGWFKKHPRLHSESLHRLYITEVEFAPDRESFVLRKSYKKRSPGYLIEMRDFTERRPSVTRIDADGKTPSVALTLTGDSAKSLGFLWDHIESGISDLRHYRDSLLEAKFGDTPVDKLEEPGELADAILDALAPFIREMRVRSKVSGELVLKRDSGDGRREELFVPRKRLESKFANLPDHNRRHFEAVGLSGEATIEFIGRHTAAAPAKIPPPVPRQRARSDRARRSPVPPPPPLPRKFSSPMLCALPEPADDFVSDDENTITRGEAA